MARSTEEQKIIDGMTSEIIKRLQTGLVKDVKPKELNNTAWDTFFQHLENTGLKQLLFGVAKAPKIRQQTGREYEAVVECPGIFQAGDEMIFSFHRPKTVIVSYKGAPYEGLQKLTYEGSDMKDAMNKAIEGLRADFGPLVKP